MTIYFNCYFAPSVMRSASSLVIVIVSFLLCPSLHLCQISIPHLLNRPPHPADDPPPDPSQHVFLPTLIVPGSIEYRTTIDGVVIKFTTADAILTRITPTATILQRTTNAFAFPSVTPSPSDSIVSANRRVHEGFIEIVADSNVVSKIDGSDVEASQLSLPHLFPLVPSAPSTMATPELPEHTIFEPKHFHFVLSSSSFPHSIITPSSTQPYLQERQPRVWRTKLPHNNSSWKSSSNDREWEGSERRRSVIRSKDASSPTSRERVRMNRLKLKVTNTEQLYDICLKDVCLRGQMPEAVLLLISGGSSSYPLSSNELS